MPNSSSVPKAAVWMAGWLSLMVVTAIAGREATRHVTVFQLMFMRSVIGLALLWPLVRASGGLPVLKTQRFGQHVLRNGVHYAAQYGWFAALTLIPLAHVVALEFTMPFWTALLAAAFLGERYTLPKAAAVLFGMVGVLLIVRPSASGASIGQAIALAAAVGFAVSVTLTKSLTRTEAPVAILFWMLVVQSVLGLAPALAAWRWPAAEVWPWIVGVSISGTFSHYCMARALNHADATVVVPIDFVRVPLTALAGWWLYAERFDGLAALGAGLILAGNLFNLLRQRPRTGGAAAS